MTSIERTLIDVAVRPAYAGGIENVLEAYRRAQGLVSVDKVIATLQRLDHVYPYHQAIGFYMERAGYPHGYLAQLKALGLDLDFYLAHGIHRTNYNKDWRLHHPSGL